MKSTIAPVDEINTEFLVHPPRPLFPNVQTLPGGGDPTFDDEVFVIGATRSSVKLVINGQRASVDFEVTT